MFLSLFKFKNYLYMISHTVGFFTLEKGVELLKRLKNPDFYILIKFDHFGAEYMEDSDVDVIF